MCKICSNMTHILDRMVSIMEHHVPLKAKLNSDDAEHQITIDTLEADEFVFPENLGKWYGDVLEACNRYTVNQIFKNNSCQIIRDNANHIIWLDARRGRYIQFAPGIKRERLDKYHPSYAEYKVVSTDPVGYRRINSIGDVDRIIAEFLAGLRG